MAISLEGLEELEERVLPSLAPVSPWHYTPGDNFVHGAYNNVGDPGALGFNLVAIASPQELALVPPGDKAVVWLGQTNGVDNTFVQTVTPFVGDPRVFAFYVADEPNPVQVPAGNLQAESDWIHSHDPGAATFFVMNGAYAGYTPENTHMDYVGLDPYPTRTWGFEAWYVPYAVLRTELLGWQPNQIVPIYQAFGGAGIFASPSPLEAEVEQALWGLLTPTPPWDYAFSWAPYAGTSLSERPDLQVIFEAHNHPAPADVQLESAIAALEHTNPLYVPWFMTETLLNG